MSADRCGLEVCGPDGNGFEVELVPDRMSVGRSAPGHTPDVLLEPDPERWVGRTHCLLEYADGTWWLTDSGTLNGTFLLRDGRTERVEGRTRMRDQDVILIVGGRSDGGEPRHWELTMYDPYGTRKVPQVRAEPTGDVLVYDGGQARLFRSEGGVRTEVTGLSPLAHRLVRYMVGRSAEGGGAAVACTHAELIEAVWDGRSGYTAEHLRDLVFELRKRLEPERGAGRPPRFLETVPGIGYRLVVDAVGSAGSVGSAGFAGSAGSAGSADTAYVDDDG